MNADYKYDVYMAGPFFTPEQKKTMDRLKEILLQEDLRVCDPRELNPVLTDMTDEQRRAFSKKDIFDANVVGLLRSWCVIACIDDRDTGTSWELGYAYCLMTHRDGGRGPIITVSANGYGCNVMLSEAADGHFPTLEALDRRIIRLARQIKDQTDGGVLKDSGFYDGALADAVE